MTALISPLPLHGHPAIPLQCGTVAEYQKTTRTQKEERDVILFSSPTSSCP